MMRRQWTAVIPLLAIIGLIGAAACGNDEGNGVRVESDWFTRYFDINDLLHPDDACGFEDVLVPGRSFPTEPTKISTFCSQEAVLTFIWETLGGGAAWEDPATIEVLNCIIIARSTPTILDSVQTLLDDIRASGGLPVFLEAQDQGP